MIPFSLKIVWFCITLLGAISSWTILIIVPGSRYGGLWGRLYYCLLITWLAGAFCLGMIYRMDPMRMPKGFCLFQTFSFSIAAFCLSGWCASFSIATSLAVFRPGAFDGPKAALSWHPRYIPTMIVYPILASVAYVIVVLKLDAVDPSSLDDLHCDVTGPIWVRLLGYSGISPLVSVPFLVLSVASATRLYSLAHDPSEEQSVDCGAGSITSPSIELRDRGPRRSKILASLPYALRRFGGNLSEVNSPSSYTFPMENFDDAGKDENNRLEKHGNNSLLDSPVSMTMPVFASNPSLPTRTILDQGSDPTHVYGLALTTDEADVHGSHMHDLTQEEIEVQVGLAITADEPVHMTPHPDSNPSHQTVQPPSPFKDPDSASVSSRRTFSAPFRPSTSKPKTPHRSFSTPLPPSSTPPPPTPTISIPPRTYTPSHTPYTPTFPLIQTSSSSLHEVPPSSAIHARRISPIQPLPPIAQAPDDANDRYTPIQPTLVALPSSRLRRSSSQSLHSQAPSQSQRDRGHDRKNSHDLSYPIEVYGAPALDLQDDLDTDSYKDFDSVYKVDVGLGGGASQRKFTRRDPMERLGVYNPTPPTPTLMKMEEEKRRRRRNSKNGKNVRMLMGAIKRMVLFQIGFFVTQLLASLSTIIDVSRGRLTPFGTQHIALVLAAWGPMLLWGGSQILLKIQPSIHRQ